ncbi:MAG: enoyl-CoA hydratase/isomerase family protein, partial [Alphaproteobacteria bacterium]
VRLNRPKQMNSINPDVMREVAAALKAADGDAAVSVIVLGGVGPNFGAGYDLKFPWGEHFGGRGPMSMRAMLRACVDFELTPWTCDKPVIAMVRGYCLAGSCELAMMCCVTFAADNATFGEPEIRFSTAPPALIMPWIVGLKKARELLYTGDLIDAHEALRIGMVNRLFPDDRLEAETFRYARRCAAISVEGLTTTKAAINRGAEIAGLRAALDYGVETGAILDASETETYRAFRDITAKQGLGAALRWRESQFED